jgi:hypothetical protein
LRNGTPLLVGKRFELVDDLDVCGTILLHKARKKASAKVFLIGAWFSTAES